MGVVSLEGIDAWVDFIEKNALPALSKSVNEISNISSKENSSAHELAKVILEDAGITARVIRAANSSANNPYGGQINTITRAVMVLGFENVRSLSLSCGLVESLSNAVHREILGIEMAKSFFLAVQARGMANESGDDYPEEVFIAALLGRVGELAFWSVATDDGDRLIDEMAKGTPKEDAEKLILGFTLKELTDRLVESWGISSLFNDSHRARAMESRISFAALAEKITESVFSSQDGAVDQSILEDISKITHKSVERIEGLIVSLSEAARAAIKDHGIDVVSDYIPRTKKERQVRISGQIKSDRLIEPGYDIHENNLVADEISVRTDGAIDARDMRTSILLDMIAVVRDGVDVNAFLEVSIEAISRGSDMDRVMFLMLSRDDKFFRGKYGIGWGNVKPSTLHFESSAKKYSSMRELLVDKKPIFVSEKKRNFLRDIVPARLYVFTKCDEFVLSPVVLSGKTIGLFYGDRKVSRRRVSGEDAEMFNSFCFQAGMGLCYLHNSRQRYSVY